MSEFYLLECFVGEGETARDIREYPAIDCIESWILGKRFSSAPAPIELEWDPTTDGVKKKYYDATIPLMHADLIASLQECGVDNLDRYAVSIRDSATGIVDRSYSAINVVGVIRAADLSDSVITGASSRGVMDVDFDRLAIDPAKARGMRLFRLAECVTAVVVDSSVKNGLQRRGGFGLTFVEPSEWIG